MKSRTKQYSSPTSLQGRLSPSSGSYPQISSAYWLPTPNPTPYVLPERKLFVGMLNKKFNEQDVRQLFGGHGTIEECTVLRDQTGQSKGCAFVTFGTKQSAIAAIKTLHQSQTMEGCSAPLVVKFADTQKEKEQKKIHLMHASLFSTINGNPTAASLGLTGLGLNGAQAVTVPTSPVDFTSAFRNSQESMGIPKSMSAGCGLMNGGGGGSMGTATTPTASMAASVVSQSNSLAQNATSLTSNTSLMTNPPQPVNPFIGADAITTSSLQLLQQMQAVGLQQQFLQGINGTQNESSANSVAAQLHAGLLQPLSMHNLLAMAGIGQSNAAAASNQSLSNAQLNSAAAAQLWPVTDPLTSAYTTATLPQYGGLYAPAPIQNNAISAVAGKQIEGPEGGNLFIYHLPQEFTDADLVSTFLPFGNVVSAKVFIDKQTNLSKCFGFVSYDNSSSAQSAIQAMHGFQIGTKRLKVQLKRTREATQSAAAAAAAAAVAAGTVPTSVAATAIKPY